MFLMECVKRVLEEEGYGKEKSLICIGGEVKKFVYIGMGKEGDSY